MDSNSHRSFENHQPNTGLLWFRSAPSSLLMGCTDAAAKGSSGECFETEQLISRFMNSDSFSPSFHDFEDKSVAAVTAAGYGGGSGLPPHYPRQGSAEGSYGSTAADRRRQLRPVDSASGLTRQNSSPAGLFSQFSVQNGRGLGEYRPGNGELSPSTKKLRSQLSLSSLGKLSQISEIGNESVEDGFHQIPSWNDFTGGNVMKREQEDDHANMFSSSQNGDVGGRVRVLAHHLSLPKTAAEMGAVERLLQYQDSVPCKIRAKRGCATHPRSIAERVRRTRISERMRKLQDLVPNMDKQTNTSDMLDLAVDYIKDLQRQYQNLSDNRANCKCLNRQSTISNRTV